jgi:hypothetical protein
MRIQISNYILDNFKLENHEYLVDRKHYDDYSGIQEYRLYSYLSTFFNNTIILDIGTFDGRSAVALSYNESNHVISYDIVNRITSGHKIYKKSNITFKIKNVLEDLTQDLIDKVKIVMIDIDHFEVIEKQIIDKLDELNFSGIIILDDIKHPWQKEYDCMQRLWNNLKYKKYDMTKYGHCSGTGIIFMNTDIDFIFENEKYVLVEGDGGLGNCCFQICTAIYYSENYNYNIILNDKSKSLHFGTSNFTNRTRCKIENGKMISYKETIFNKFKYGDLNQSLCKKIYNNFESNKIIPTNDDYYLLITGYCQNKDLFKDILPTLTKYLNLYDDNSINTLIHKYNIDLNKKNIMIGVRVCDDFSHMKKITAQSYKKALDLFINEHETDYNLIIISDSSDYMKMLDFNIKGSITYIDEDDISQLNIGLLCNYFILSESTYHYWIAVIKNYMDKNTKVICFNDTDLTNRNLALDDWIKIIF